MKFVTIEPFETRVRLTEATDIHMVYARLALGSNVDYAMVMRPRGPRVGISIVVSGLSLFVPPDDQRYFVLNGRLYGGNAVLYAFDEAGKTLDMPWSPAVIFMSRTGVEEAIAHGQIERPQIVINGVAIWKWPDRPPPPFMESEMS